MHFVFSQRHCKNACSMILIEAEPKSKCILSTHKGNNSSGVGKKNSTSNEVDILKVAPRFFFI